MIPKKDANDFQEIVGGFIQTECHSMSVSGGHHSFYHVGCVVTFGSAWRGRVMALLCRKKGFWLSVSPDDTLCFAASIRREGQ